MSISTIIEMDNITSDEYPLIKKVCIDKFLNDTYIEKIFNYVNLEKLIILMSKHQFAMYCDKLAILKKIKKIRIYDPQNESFKTKFRNNKSIVLKGDSGLYNLPNICTYNDCMLVENLGKCRNHNGVNTKCLLCKLRLEIINNSQIKHINVLNLNVNSYSILNNLPQNLEYLKLPYISNNKLTNIPLNLKEFVFHMPKKTNESLDKITYSLKLPFECSLSFV